MEGHLNRRLRNTWARFICTCLKLHKIPEKLNIHTKTIIGKIMEVFLLPAFPTDNISKALKKIISKKGTCNTLFSVWQSYSIFNLPKLVCNRTTNKNWLEWSRDEVTSTSTPTELVMFRQQHTRPEKPTTPNTGIAVQRHTWAQPTQPHNLQRQPVGSKR